MFVFPLYLHLINFHIIKSPTGDFLCRDFARDNFQPTTSFASFSRRNEEEEEQNAVRFKVRTKCYCTPIFTTLI